MPLYPAPPRVSTGVCILLIVLCGSSNPDPVAFPAWMLLPGVTGVMVIADPVMFPAVGETFSTSVVSVRVLFPAVSDEPLPTFRPPPAAIVIVVFSTNVTLADVLPTPTSKLPCSTLTVPFSTTTSPSTSVAAVPVFVTSV